MSQQHQLYWRKRIRHTAITMCGATLLVATGAVMAQSATSAPTSSAIVHTQRTIKFALPAEPLAETLRAIAQQSGRSVEFKASDLVGIQAPAIQGEYTPVAALQKAVGGSRATMTSTPGGGWEVFVPSSLATVTVTANIDEAETGFQATRSDTTTRSGSDLMDVPESMTIITSDVLKTQQALEIQDVLQDVSGVQTTAASQGPPGMSIRGLTVTSLSNGLTNPFATNANIAGVERIEVLKGPQAILSGGDSLGGAVNIVQKKPSADPVADLTLQDGTYGDKTASADFSGALADNGRLSGRIIGSWTRAATSDAGYEGRRENYLMPEVRWKDEHTDFTAGVSYDDGFDPLGRYTFAVQNSISPVPSMLLGNKSNGIEVKTRSVFYSLEHKFAPWLSFVSRVNRSLVDQSLNIWGAAFPLDVPSMTFAFLPTNNISRYETTSSDNYLRFSFHTGEIEHVLSTGVNTTGLTNSQNQWTLQNFVPGQPYASEPIAFPYVSRDAANYFGINRIAAQQYGLYAQDLATWGDFHALLNLRRTYYQEGPDSTVIPQYNYEFGTPKQSIDKTTPGAGLVYNVTPNLSAYAEYSEGFQPDFSTTTLCGGGFAQSPPLSSRNAEVGLKLASSDGLFSLTSSAFNLNETNVLQYNPAMNCNVLIKGQRTRGVEFDAQGQIAKGWNLIANLTHSTYTNVGQAGFLIPGEPRNHVSLWSTYDFQGGPLKGFGIGGGITAYSRSWTYVESGYPSEPGGARVDLSAYYRWQKQWRFTLGVKNVFDRTLYGVTATPLYVPVNPGRTAMFTVEYSFLK